MSQFSVYIRVPDYLDQWLRHEYWNQENARVEFPRGSAPRAVLQCCLRKQPRGYIPPDRDGLLPIEVPTFKGINPSVYNYLPDTGRKALTSTCKRMFQRMMWDELHTLFSHDVLISDIVYAFLDRHGIEPTERNWETVRQMYSRMRQRSANPDALI